MGGLNERLHAELHKTDQDEILDLVKCRQWFMDYNNRHKYDLLPLYKDTVGMIDKRVAELIREYEKEWGRRIPLYILRRYVKS